MIEIVNSGGVTSASGFSAGGTHAGLKSEIGALDLGLLISDRDSNVAATFTTNKIEAPSVSVSRERLKQGVARGVVAAP